MSNEIARILSLRLLTGESPLGYEPGIWLRRESDWAAVAEQAHTRQISAVTTVSNGDMLGMLKRGLWRRFEVIPQIPNVTGIIRETYDYGPVGAGLRRLAMIGPVSAVKVGFTGLANVGGVLRKDFPSMLKVLLDLEFRAFQRFKPERMILSPQITDMAIAFENPRIVELFAEYSKNIGVKPYLSTNNPMQLADRLGRWGVPVDGVVAPINRGGYLCGDMSWSDAASIRAIELIGETLGGGRTAEESDVEFASSRGARAVIMDADAVY